MAVDVIVWFVSEQEVIEPVKADYYKMILMDIQMPKLDGWEATKVIRRMNREDIDIPILAMSANAFVEDRRKSQESGMNGHISKPVDYDEVRRIIGEQLWAVRSH